MVVRTFAFARRDVAAIKKRLLPARLRGAATTAFEVLTAALLEIPPDEEVRLALIVGFRGVRELGLPTGYYGNAAVPSAAVTTAGELLRASSLGDTVKMVQEAKAAVTAEFVRSTVDFLALHERRPAMAGAANLLVVSDNRHLGLHRVDLGWGVPVYGGISTPGFGGIFIVAVSVGNGDGKDAVAVPIVLPRPAMDPLALEIETMLSPLLVDLEMAPPAHPANTGYTAASFGPPSASVAAMIWSQNSARDEEEEELNGP